MLTMNLLQFQEVSNILYFCLIYFQSVSVFVIISKLTMDDASLSPSVRSSMTYQLIKLILMLLLAIVYAIIAIILIGLIHQDNVIFLLLYAFATWLSSIIFIIGYVWQRFQQSTFTQITGKCIITIHQRHYIRHHTLYLLDHGVISCKRINNFWFHYHKMTIYAWIIFDYLD